MKAIFLILLASTQSGATVRQPSASGMQCFHEGTSVQLSGSVIHRNFYGPPNYGETPATDRLMHIPILRLESAITPCELTEFDRENRKLGEPVREVQIVSSKQMKDGKDRTIAGTIHPATMGPEFLDYVLYVP